MYFFGIELNIVQALHYNVFYLDTINIKKIFYVEINYVY